MLPTSEEGLPLYNLAIRLFDRSSSLSSRKPRRDVRENSRSSLCVRFRHLSDLRG